MRQHPIIRSFLFPFPGHAGLRSAWSNDAFSMTSTEVATWLGRVIDADAPAVLAALAEELRQRFPGDDDAERVARQAELKRQRLTQEN